MKKSMIILRLLSTVCLFGIIVLAQANAQEDPIITGEDQSILKLFSFGSFSPFIDPQISDIGTGLLGVQAEDLQDIKVDSGTLNQQFVNNETIEKQFTINDIRVLRQIEVEVTTKSKALFSTYTLEGPSGQFFILGSPNPGTITTPFDPTNPASPLVSNKIKFKTFVPSTNQTNVTIQNPQAKFLAELISLPINQTVNSESVLINLDSSASGVWKLKIVNIAPIVFIDGFTVVNDSFLVSYNIVFKMSSRKNNIDGRDDFRF